VAALLLVVGVKPAESQILYGSIVGNVKDTSNAVVPGAQVVVTHKETNQSREATTNSVGAYSFPTLQPSPYELRVSHEGFRTFTQSEVLVTINSVTRADVELQLGAVAESVVVTGVSAVLQTDRSEVRSEVTPGYKVFREMEPIARPGYAIYVYHVGAAGRPDSEKGVGP